jgi:hypothetical protein
LQLQNSNQRAFQDQNSHFYQPFIPPAQGNNAQAAHFLIVAIFCKIAKLPVSAPSLTNPTKSVHDAPRTNEYQSFKALHKIPTMNKKDTT